MERDATRMRGERPFVFSNMKTGQGLRDIIEFIVDQGMLGTRDLGDLDQALARSV